MFEYIYSIRNPTVTTRKTFFEFIISKTWFLHRSIKDCPGMLNRNFFFNGKVNKNYSHSHGGKIGKVYGKTEIFHISKKNF